MSRTCAGVYEQRRCLVSSAVQRGTWGMALLIAVLAMGASPAGGAVLYVDCQRPGGGDGSSWATAYTFLQDALAAAHLGAEIRVAQGVHRPDLCLADPAGTSDLAVSFTLPLSVVLKGGYAGYGAPDPDARDVALYETILSGDLGETGRSPHVVRCPSTLMTVLDGFTITGGDATSSMFGLGDWGGGLEKTGGTLYVNQCTFADNRAASFGGGVVNIDGTIVLTGCTFVGNAMTHSYGKGGGLANLATATLIDCTFMSNAAKHRPDPDPFGMPQGVDGRGGGVYNKGDAILVGCTFTENEAYDGGAVYNDGYSSPGDIKMINCTVTRDRGDRASVENYDGVAALTNCVLAGNFAIGFAGGGYRGDGMATIRNCTIVDNERGIVVKMGGNIAVANSILWGNGYPGLQDERAQIQADFGTVSVDYSCVQGWTGSLGGTGNIGDDPQFVLSPNFNHLTGNLRLRTTSPCLDAGDNAAVPADVADLDDDSDTAEPTPLDMAGQPRFVDTPTAPDTGSGTAPIVDMGAYEGAVLVGDINLDGSVNGADLLAMALSFPSQAGDANYNPACDISGDGRVNAIDLLLLAQNWGGLPS